MPKVAMPFAAIPVFILLLLMIAFPGITACPIATAEPAAESEALPEQNPDEPATDEPADADAAENAATRMTPKLWFGLPGFLDNRNCANEIAALFRAPSPELNEALSLATVMEIRCTSLKQGAFADDAALTAIIEAVAPHKLQLIVRVGVLGRTEKQGFQKDLDALARLERLGGHVDGIICESVLSSAKERTGMDKGGQVEERSACVADAVLRIRETLDHDVRVFIGDTSLAQGQKRNRQDKYDFAEDTRELLKITAEKGVTIAGFIEAYNNTRMSEDAAEIAAAVQHLHECACEIGIIPINDETDPERYQAAMVAQVKTIYGAEHKPDWIVSSTWNRPEAVPTLQQHVMNTLAIATAAKQGIVQK